MSVFTEADLDDRPILAFMPHPTVQEQMEIVARKLTGQKVTEIEEICVKLSSEQPPVARK